MTPEMLRARTKRFALDIVRFWRRIPTTDDARVLGRQLLRSATSVGANYRSACLARSKAEFVARMGLVLEEADETVFWLELLEESGATPAGAATGLRNEALQLTRIFAASLRTARGPRTPRDSPPAQRPHP